MLIAGSGSGDVSGMSSADDKFGPRQSQLCFNKDEFVKVHANDLLLSLKINHVLVL